MQVYGTRFGDAATDFHELLVVDAPLRVLFANQPTEMRVSRLVMCE